MGWTWKPQETRSGKLPVLRELQSEFHPRSIIKKI